ncbi:MAG: FecR domain-containing protein [Agriterribacter sp.]
MERSDRINFLFEKFLAQQCSLREVEELVALLQQAEAEQALSGQMKKIWEDLRFDRTEYKVDWPKMYNSIITSQQHADQVLRRATHKRRSHYYIAAAFVIVLSVSTYFLIPSKGTSNNTSLAQQKITPVNEADSKRQTIHLKDGSTVTLNTAASLDYPAAFNEKRRDVYLKGEAYFDIRHMDSKPFFVHVGAVTIKVLGTAFNIKADTLQDHVQVTVTRGKVQVLKNAKTLGVLTASQQLSVNDTSGKVVIKTVNTQEVLRWKPAEIFFNDITIREAMQQLEQRFGVHINVVNPQAALCNITATFTEDDSLEQMLDVICAVSKLQYSISKNNIKIEGNGCN